MTPMDWYIPGFCGMGMHLRLDGFRLVYLGIAVLMWGCSGVFSREYMAHYEKKLRYYGFFWATFVATAGVFLSADLYTTFIFFEVMSFTSYVWVAFDEKPESLRAAETYLAVAVIGGMVMLMGLFLLSHLLGTLELDELKDAAALAAAQGHETKLYVAGGLLLFGFGAKAGCFPLHIWLPKAHPVAPAPASALLSGILTKTGIFGIIVVSCRMFGADRSWGLLMVILGLVTMFLGALLAVFSINLKRTLACSSVSQIGFILTGIGMSCMLAAAGENPSIAARGAFLHMVNHSLFKLVLFLCAGAVYMNLHELDLNAIRGFGRGKPLLAFCFLMGALGLGGIPGWSGYVSKTLIHESIVEYGELLAEAAAGTAGMAEAAVGATDMAEMAAGAVSVAGTVGSPGVAVGWRLDALVSAPAFWTVAEWIFLITGGMTVAYMLKLFLAIFVEKNEDPARQAQFDQYPGSGMKPASGAALLLPAALIPIMGLLPAVVMDPLADLGQGFFLAEGMEHGVSYFSPGNLTGALISVTIGAAVYGIGIRRGLMAETAGEKIALANSPRAGASSRKRRYINRWPRLLDLEELLYRPVLQTFLPGVFGAVCGFLDKYLISVAVSVFLAVASVVCRAMDQTADGGILLARRTTHRQIRETPKDHQDRLARWVGHVMDNWFRFRLRLRGQEVPPDQLPSRIPGLVRLEQSVWRTGHMVEESFSFGLMLFCIGLCLTLGYLLVEFIRI